MMWGWPLPRWFDGNHIAMGLVQLLLAGIVMVINQKFFINGFKGLVHRSPNWIRWWLWARWQALCGAPTPCLP